MIKQALESRTADGIPDGFLYRLDDAGRLAGVTHLTTLAALALGRSAFADGRELEAAILENGISERTSHEEQHRDRAHDEAASDPPSRHVADPEDQHRERPQRHHHRDRQSHQV
jgi:hypothetical protein